MKAAYDVDLAYIHDTGYGDFVKTSAPSLLRILSDCDDTSELIIDLGCGSGIWAKSLVASGYQVVGVDISAAMIAIARQRVPDAAFHIGSFVDFDIPACRAVTALGEVFNYLFDPNNSLNTLRQVCRRVFDALAPNGVFIFDIAEPARFNGLRQSFREGEDWACLVEYVHNEGRQQLTRDIVTFRKIGEAYRRQQETHVQQLYERQAVLEMLENIGFQGEMVSSYGAMAFPAGLVGFVARKAAK